MVFWSSGKKVEERQEEPRMFLRGQRGGLGLEGLSGAEVGVGCFVILQFRCRQGKGK